VQDIAKWIKDTKVFSRLTGLAALCLAAGALSGCMGAGLGLASSSDVDRTVATGSVPQPSNEEDNVDAITVRNAVSSADVTKMTGNPIPWANSSSGSAGVISNIAEEEVNGTICRSFTTTRHSYQGIANFNGQTCMLGTGEWYLTSFGPRS
jgi:hypothetical protein